MPLTFAPENGHMLGGTMVNITGPCFEPNMRVTCRFNTIGKKKNPLFKSPCLYYFKFFSPIEKIDSEGVVLNENRASCIMPWTEAEGWVDFEISLKGGPFYWKGSFYVGTYI